MRARAGTRGREASGRPARGARGALAALAGLVALAGAGAPPAAAWTERAAAGAAPSAATATSAPWTELAARAAPAGAAAACLRPAGRDGLALLGAVGRDAAGTELLRLGPGGLEPAGGATLGWLAGCAEVATAPGVAPVLAARLHAGRRGGIAIAAGPVGGPVQELRRSAAADASTPAVALAPDGAATVAWIEGPRGTGRRGSVVAASRPSAAAPFGEPVAIAHERFGRDGGIGDVHLALDAAGRATLAWAATAPGPHGRTALRVATLPAGGGPAQLQRLPGRLDGAAPWASEALAVAPNGRALLAVATGATVRAWERLPGAAEPTPVDLPGEQVGGEVAVAVRDDGAALLAQRNDGEGPFPRRGEDHAVAAVRPAGGAFGAPRRLAGRSPDVVSTAQMIVALAERRGRRPEPSDDREGALGAAIGADGEALVTWVEDAGTVLASLRVAEGSVHDGLAAAEPVGAACRPARSSAPLVRADGSLALAWTDDGRWSGAEVWGHALERRGGRGAVRVAAPSGARAPASPRAGSGATARVVGPRALRAGQPLRLRVACPRGPCDVRVQARARALRRPARPALPGRAPEPAERDDAEPHATVAAGTTLRAGDAQTLRLDPGTGYRFAVGARGRLAARVTSCAPGGAALAREVAHLPVRTRAPRPVPWLVDVRATRVPAGVRVSWTTSGPAVGAEFVVVVHRVGALERAEVERLRVGRDARRTRFSVLVPLRVDPGSARALVAVSTQERGGVDQRQVRVRGRR